MENGIYCCNRCCYSSEACSKATEINIESSSSSSQRMFITIRKHLWAKVSGWESESKLSNQWPLTM